MPIIHYPGFTTKEKIALAKKVQVRAINEHIRKKKLEAVRIDRFVFVKDPATTAPPPPDIVLSSLIWVPGCATANKMWATLLYEQIIMGNITGVVICSRVFVIRTEPALLTYLATRKRK
jgi:hypothetical protein